MILKKEKNKKTEQSKIKKEKALPFKLSELLSEKMLIKHTTRANLIFKILFRG
jgi:hypothetical protein